MPFVQDGLLDQELSHDHVHGISYGKTGRRCHGFGDGKIPEDTEGRPRRGEEQWFRREGFPGFGRVSSTGGNVGDPLIGISHPSDDFAGNDFQGTNNNADGRSSSSTSIFGVIEFGPGALGHFDLEGSSCRNLL